jgi:hypothetical protein
LVLTAYAGNADVPVRSAPWERTLIHRQIAKYVSSRFALIADEDVRAPSKMKLPDFETASPLFNCFKNQLAQYLCMLDLDLNLSRVAR